MPSPKTHKSSMQESLAAFALAYLVFDGFNHGVFDVRWGNSMSLTALAVAVCAACVLVDGAKRPQRLQRLWTLPTVALAMFLFTVVVSAVTIGAGLDVSFIKNGVIVVTIVHFVDSERWIKRMLAAAAAAAAVQFAFGLLQGARIGIPATGLSGLLPNHVQYGLYLGVAALAWIPFVTAARARESTVAGTLLLLPVGVIVLASKARGSIIALLAAIILATVLGSTSHSVKVRVSAAAVATFALAATLSERLRQVLRLPFVLGDIQQVDAILTTRGQFLGAAWNMFTENPLFGLGYGRYVQRWYEYAPPELLNPWSVGHPFAAHSTYLQILAELGVIGFVLYIAAIVGGIRCGAWASRHAVGSFARTAGIVILAGLLAFVLHGILDNSGWHDRAFYIFLGLAFAAPRALGASSAGNSFDAFSELSPTTITDSQ